MSLCVFIIAISLEYLIKVLILTGLYWKLNIKHSLFALFIYLFVCYSSCYPKIYIFFGLNVILTNQHQEIVTASFMILFAAYTLSLYLT